MTKAPRFALSVVLFVASTLACLHGSAFAQTPGQAAADGDGQSASPSHGISWLTGYRFHLSAASFRTGDPRFNWDAHFGGDLDVADYGFGRLNILADYQVIVGSQLRLFDPNQGAYRLDASASFRTPPAELRVVFHHISRHMIDRSNTLAVAWNTVGLEAIRSRSIGPVKTIVEARAAKVVTRAFVDYNWQFGTATSAEYPFTKRYAVTARFDVDEMFVYRQIAGRGPQTGTIVETGFRVYGTQAGAEFFGAWERRIDAYPTDRIRATWFLLGFRLISR